MSIQSMLEELAARTPAPVVAETETKPTYHCRNCDDWAVVENQNDICELCKMENERGYQAQMLAGRCANGAELDHGTRTHAVMITERFGFAVCGAKPGRRSVGWVSPYKSREITCPRCLKKIQAVTK